MIVVGDGDIDDSVVEKVLGLGMNSSKGIVSIVKTSEVSVISILKICPDDSQP